MVSKAALILNERGCGGVSLHRSSVQFRSDVCFRYCTDDLVNNPPPLKKQRRDRVDAVLHSHALIIVNVKFTDFCFAIVIAGDFFDERGDHAARTAPCSPEIHKNGFIGNPRLLLEIVVGRCVGSDITETQMKKTSEMVLPKLRNFHHFKKPSFHFSKTERHQETIFGKSYKFVQKRKFCLMVKSHTLSLYVFSVWALYIHPIKKASIFPLPVSAHVVRDLYGGLQPRNQNPDSASISRR